MPVVGGQSFGLHPAGPAGWNLEGVAWAERITQSVRLMETRKIDVTDTRFGAKGDGVTDDTPAIRKAIAAALSEGVRHIHFPRCSGSYRITRAGLSDGAAALEIPSDFTVTGDGPGAPLLFTGVVGAPGGLDYVAFRVLSGSKRVVFRGLSFKGENDPFTMGGEGRNASACIEIGTSNTTEDVLVAGCSFENLHGFSVHDAGNTQRIHVIGCRFVRCGNGLNVNASHSIQANNSFYLSEGIECGGAFCVISGNTFRDVQGVAISAGGNQGPANLRPGTSVIGNVIDGCTGTGIVITDNFINGTVSGNTVRRCQTMGLLMFASTGDFKCGGNVVSNNVIASNCINGGNTIIGMEIQGTGGNVITGNVVVDEGVSGFTQQYAILTRSKNIITGNRLSGTSKDASLSVGSDGSIFHANLLDHGTVVYGTGVTLASPTPP